MMHGRENIKLQGNIQVPSAQVIKVQNGVEVEFH